ncbi:phage tail tape measure protein [Alsobacter sp. SYSU M60028]|uniref:Phage tail tape measure protein n=1 Tax=Alsobacter ponti TaxID=2962936 RepID=A0ABT1L9K9_9HYPH|nr:phage tail tape measure protein [Alsobacter ponti]MCP8937781.1 phage tail tape measure protein [Alsobacter ponti]
MDPLTDLPGLDPERFDALTRSAERFGGALTAAFAGGVARGRSFDQVLQGVGARLIDIGLRAAMQPFEAALSGVLRSAASALAGGFGGAGGASVRPFADGGVIASPTWFPLGRDVGLAGEAGPEAILPLSRGSDGRLGVRASGGARPVQVNVSIATPDADSFRRSEAQISAALARAVARGQRAL